MTPPLNAELSANVVALAAVVAISDHGSAPFLRSMRKPFSSLLLSCHVRSMRDVPAVAVNDDGGIGGVPARDRQTDRIVERVELFDAAGRARGHRRRDGQRAAAVHARGDLEQTAAVARHARVRLCVGGNGAVDAVDLGADERAGAAGKGAGHTQLGRGDRSVRLAQVVTQREILVGACGSSDCRGAQRALRRPDIRNTRRDSAAC